MKIAGRLEWTDYLYAHRLSGRPSRPVQIALYVCLGLFILALLFALIVFALHGGLLENLLSIWPAVLIIIGVPLYFFVFLPRRVRQLFYQHREMSSPFEHEITASGVASSNAYGHADRPWENFRKWKADQRVFMLYLSDIQFLLIPIRFFTAEQLAALHGYLRDNNIPDASRSNRGYFIAILIYVAILIMMGWMLYSVFRSSGP